MARERYLLNQQEDTIHSNVITADTPSEKRKNWWFYHKGHLLIALIAGAIIFSIVYSIASKVKPDYSVALITSYTMPQNGCDELERCIAQYADDRNGDGKVVINIDNYVISADDITTSEQLERQQASISRLAADCVTNDSIIFMYEEASFNVLAKDFVAFFSYNDGTPMPENALDYENARHSWDEFKGFASFTPQTKEDDLFDSSMLSQLYEHLWVSVRCSEGTSIETKEKYMDYYKDCLALYDRIKNDEKLS